MEFQGLGTFFQNYMHLYGIKKAQLIFEFQYKKVLFSIAGLMTPWWRWGLIKTWTEEYNLEVLVNVC